MFVRILVNNVRYSTVPINPSLLTIILYSSVETTFVYKDTKHSVNFMTSKSSSTLLHTDIQSRVTEFIGGNFALPFILCAIECLSPVCKNLISYSGRPVANLDPKTGDFKWEISWFSFPLQANFGTVSHPVYHSIKILRYVNWPTDAFDKQTLSKSK